MPCVSDYLNSSNLEKEMTKVVQLLDELDGKKLNKSKFGDGYDERVYNKGLSKKDRDKLVSTLCSRLKNTKKVNVTKYSLELQMWWRDHKEADKKRIRQEKEKREQEKIRKQALSKLTPEERKSLGLS